MASLIPIRLVDASGKPNFLRSGSVIKSTGRDEKAEEEGGEEMWNVLSKNEDLRSELGSYIPASQHINIGTPHYQTHKYIYHMYSKTVSITHALILILKLTNTLTHTPTHILTHILTHSCTYVRALGNLLGKMNSNVCVLAMDWTSYDGKGWLNLLDLDKVSAVA
jgi:hypothetical protein